MFPLVEVTSSRMRIAAFRGGRYRLTQLEEVGSFPAYMVDIIRCSPERGKVALTRPRLRVITSTKWEVNMTRKYRVASFVMDLKMVGILSPPALDLRASKTINENARKSDANAVWAESVTCGLDLR